MAKRANNARRKTLKKPAICLLQSKKHPVYLTSLTGTELEQVAEISRLARSDAGKLLGYQRPEVKRHVSGIVDYLNGPDIVFPNSIILSFSSSVRFVPRANGRARKDGIRAGVLEIPLPRNGDRKPAWIVDGQQRALAIGRSKRRDTPFPISAFVADGVDLQRDQFLRINNTKQLPRGLINELLPHIDGALPKNLSPRKAPAAICDILCLDPESPFFGLIRRASTPKALKKTAVIADTSIIKMVEESLLNPSGCLFPYTNLATGKADYDQIKAILFVYWRGIQKVFPEAWGLPPTQSRLMHGVGIKSMGRLMDRVMPVVDVRRGDALQLVRREVKRIVSKCAWTKGRWSGLEGLRWNELQNVPRHVRMLSNLLTREYLEACRR